LPDLENLLSAYLNDERFILSLTPVPFFRIKFCDKVPKTVLVHYDRACAPDGSFITPGANDNSAAVFQVLRFAERLMRKEIPLPGGIHNMRIFFTDGEELGASSVSGAKAQGAFALASLFRKLGIVNDDVFVLDGCGRGDVLAVSTAGKNSNAPLGFAKRFDALFEHACSHSYAFE